MDNELALVGLSLLLFSIILILEGHIGLGMVELTALYLYCSFCGE